jgi:2-isopropylmalate synthase
MLKHQETYEIMRPETVGASNTLLVLGKHSGRHGFAARLRELGHALEGEALDHAFKRFKVLADKKKRITDADLDALAASEGGRGHEYFRFDAVQVTCGSNGMPTATVRLITPDGSIRTHAAVGTGPVHAVFRAIDEMVEAPSELLEYSINAVTEGIDALGHASVRVRAAQSDARVNPQHGSGGSAIFSGHAAETDVIVASTKAYLHALNRLLAALGTHDRQHASTPETRPGAA